MPPCLCGRAMASQPCCDVLPWLKKTYRGPIDADHHQITYIGQQQCRSLVRAYIVYSTELTLCPRADGKIIRMMVEEKFLPECYFSQYEMQAAAKLRNISRF